MYLLGTAEAKLNILQTEKHNIVASCHCNAMSNNNIMLRLPVRSPIGMVIKDVRK